jgi:hypothetical protein
MAYSKAKLKSNGDRASPCLRPFLIGNAPDKFLPIEQSRILNIIQQHRILGYFRYVDDILIAYNELTTDIDHMLAEFN